MRGERALQALAGLVPTRPAACVFSHTSGDGAVRRIRGSYTGSSRALYEWALGAGMDATWLYGREGSDGVPGPSASLTSRRGVAAALRARVSVGGVNNGVPHPLLSDATWVVQVWHGTPLKRIGRAFPGEGARDVAIRERADFFVSAGPEYTRRMQRCYALDDERFWETGNPRNDRLVRATPEERTDLRARLARATGIAFEGPVVLYAPTWREWGSPRLPFGDGDLARLSALVAGLDGLLVTRVHDREAGRLAAAACPRVVSSDTAGPGWDVNDWLIASDVLVTDYSSIYFDYLLLDRPVIHHVHDLEEYTRRRGFVVDPWEDFAGDSTRTPAELGAAIERALAEPGRWAARRAALRALHDPLDDGAASERVGGRILRLLEEERRPWAPRDRVPAR